MCMICVEFQEDKLTKAEARRALLEMAWTEGIDPLHVLEVADIIEGETDGE